MSKTIYFLMIFIMAISTYCYAAETAVNYVHGKIDVSNSLADAETTGDTFAVVLNQNSNDFPNAAARVTVYGSSCSQPSSCATREILTISAASCAGTYPTRICTLTIAARNQESTTHSGDWTTGDKVVMVLTAESNMIWPDSGVAVSTGSAWTTSLSTDGSGDCSSGTVCLGDHTHSGYLAGTNTITVCSSGCTYTTLNAAIAAYPATQVTVLILGSVATTTDTVPATMTVVRSGQGLLTFATGQVLTFATGSKFVSDSQQAFSCYTTENCVAFNAGTIASVRPEWWGAKADNSTDNSLPIPKAIVAANGRELIWSAGTYLMTTGISKTFTGTQAWRTEGNTTIKYTGSSTTYFMYFELSGNAFTIDGTITFDANNLAAMAMRVDNDTTTFVDLYVSQAIFQNAYNVTNDFTGAGLYVYGAYNKFECDNCKASNILRQENLTGSPANIGLAYAHGGVTKYAKKVVFNNPYVDTVVVDMTTPDEPDSHCINVSGPAADANGGIKMNTSLEIHGGYLRNCGSWKIKSQMESTTIDGGILIVTDATSKKGYSGGGEITSQYGSINLSDFKVFYEPLSGGASSIPTSWRIVEADCRAKATNGEGTVNIINGEIINEIPTGTDLLPYFVQTTSEGGGICNYVNISNNNFMGQGGTDQFYGFNSANNTVKKVVLDNNTINSLGISLVYCGQDCTGTVIHANGNHLSGTARLIVDGASTYPRFSGIGNSGWSGSNAGVVNDFRIGANGDVDYALTFDANSNDGVLTWMEDEDYCKFSDDVLMDSTEKIYFRDTAISINSADDGRMDLDADTSIDLNQNTTITGNLTLTGSFTFDESATSLVNHAKGQVIASVYSIVDKTKIKGFWIFDQTGAVSTITDRSGNSHTATLRNDSLVAINASTCTPGISGFAPYLTFDTTHLWNTPDHADFSFDGDGASDTVFSVVALINPTDVTSSAIVAKNADGATPDDDSEWVFSINSSDLLSFALFHQDGATYIIRRYGTAITSDEGSWHTYAATYHASDPGILGDINIYRDGIVIDDTDATAGSYDSMTGTDTEVGSYTKWNSGITNPMKGKVSVILIVQEELSAAQVRALDYLLRGYAGVSY